MSSVAEQIAEATWQRLEQARRYDVRLGEETLTDLLALEWARSNRDHYRLFQTTKAHEARRGTDIEIRIRVGRGSAIVVAIQAKKLSRSTDRYVTLGARVRSTGYRQIDVLERFAKQSRAKALYLLYNHIDVPNPARYWHCCRELDKPQLGCTLVPAAHIREVLDWRRGGRDFRSIHSHRGVVPWRCLFECPKALDPSARGTKGIEAHAHRLLALADSGFAIDGAWPNWLWDREGDEPMSEDELTRLYEGEVRSFDSLAEQGPGSSEPPRLVPRRVLLVDDFERAH